jgi:glycosyltransferase involved in cell wall biosynthesis
MTEEQRKDREEDFDGHFYLMMNPDVAANRQDPWEHYVNYGHAEGRSFPNKYDTNIMKKYTKFLSSGYFDPEWYLATYPDVRASGKNPLQHFCELGAWEGRDPSRYFSTTWYLEQYPDVQNCNPLEHFIDHGVKEGRTPAPPRGALMAAERTFGSICDLEPDLYTQEKLYSFKGVSFCDGKKKNNKLKRILHEILRRVPEECTRMIFVPWLIRSGADVVLTNTVRKALELFESSSILVVVVDHADVEGRDWLPDETNVISFSDFDPELTSDERGELIEKLLLVARPKKILNINSRACWDLFRDRGEILKRYSDLFACLFCRDYNSFGAPSGYADTHFRGSMSHLTAIYFDNAKFMHELAAQYSLLDNDIVRLKLVKQPVMSISKSDIFGASEDKKLLDVLWAARITRQKNYKLLSEIIDLSPKTFVFHIWGGGHPDDLEKVEKFLCGRDNVKLCGPYPTFRSLPLLDYDAYLYTSAWDGIPNALLEAASYGLPVVASKVGGIPEVVNDARGWLVDPPERPAPYISALEEVARDRDKARRKADALASFLAIEHSWDKFGAAICGPSQFLGEA